MAKIQSARTYLCAKNRKKSFKAYIHEKKSFVYVLLLITEIISAIRWHLEEKRLKSI
jgi:hypothetical protein